MADLQRGTATPVAADVRLHLLPRDDIHKPIASNFRSKPRYLGRYGRVLLGRAFDSTEFTGKLEEVCPARDYRICLPAIGGFFRA